MRPSRPIALVTLTFLLSVGSCAGLCAGLLAPAIAQAQSSEPAWSAPVGTEPCGAEGPMEAALARDAAYRQRAQLFEALVQEAQRKGLMPLRANVSGPSYVIPVAVHIVHQNGPENISDAQVMSQLYALNRDYADSTNAPFPAVNTNIQFCLATLLPNASPVVWSTTPGITRTFSAQTFHTYGNPASEAALKAIAYLPSSKYLNIWVVNNIAGGGGGVAGYATFPGMVPPQLDGIVCRYTCFGSNSTPYGTFPNLLVSNPDGKIMSHECGHYLNLLHTFHGGCAVPGDNVADTPPEQVCRTGCPVGSLTSCTNVNDPIENFMDYTNDACRNAFTAGQKVRMQNAIAFYRATLVSGTNLADVGCDSGLNALINSSKLQMCAGDTTTFSTPAAGAGWTYAWSFPGGVPSSASTQVVNVQYPTPGVYPATLTVTDGFYGVSTNSVTIYAKTCTPITGPCRNWVFPANAALDFGSGVPVAVSGRVVVSTEPASVVSDNAGNVRFYTDGISAYTNTNVVMPNGTGLLAGGSAHNGTMIIPRPGSANQYFLFTIRQWEDNPNTNMMNYSVVDMSLNGGLGAIVTGQKNIPVALPGTPNSMVEGMAAIPHCNGTDWWLVSHGAWNTDGKVFVTLVQAAGPVSTAAYNIGLSAPAQPLGVVVPSRDGTRIAAICATGGSFAVWNFNRTTGVPTTLVAPNISWGGYSDIAFSPNGKLVYFNQWTGTNAIVHQVNLATLQERTIWQGPNCAIKPGPDGLIYIAPGSATRLHVINYPDNFNQNNLNECGLNLDAVPLPAGATVGYFGALPNQPLQCSTVPAADFTYTITNCLTVTCTSLNCPAAFTWNFGDATSGGGSPVLHTYAAPGTYTITLTVPGAVPSTISKTVTLGLQPVTIAGPNTICAAGLNNYTAVGPANYTYTWAIAGGNPAAATGNNVDVTWTGASGVVTLTVTDSTSGCTQVFTKNVNPCPTCTSPPANMSAWYPLDEPTGTSALETVLGANGVDVAGALHTPGFVRRGRTFNGTNQFVQANNAAGLNFGAGDLTIDAWVRTTQTSGLAPIVDKRSADPELGYSLYLKNGRLALKLGDGTLSSEYWSPTTPYVADGQWHHVTGELKRSLAASGTRLFVDGATVASFPAYTGGSVTNTEKLLIGAQAGFVSPVAWLAGSVDEVELFQRALQAPEINAIVMADTLGKCKEYSYVPSVVDLCRDDADVTITMQVCNYTTAAQTYNVAFAGLPTGGVCTFAGPTGFTLLTSMPITVPANSCAPVQYKVARPLGMPLYAQSCYQVTVTNTNTFASTVNLGALYSSRRWCHLHIKGPVGVGNTGGTAKLTFHTSNMEPVAASVPYTITLTQRGGSSTGVIEDPMVSLNGLPPGDAIHGVMNLPPSGSADIDVTASFKEPRAFRFYDLQLLLDEDGDGIDQVVATAGLTYGPTTTPVSVPPPAPVSSTALALGVTPNPVRSLATIAYQLPRRGMIELTLYDVAGRVVRSIPRFLAEAGQGATTLDCRGLGRGVYFVRMRVGGQTVGQRFLLLQ